MMNSTVRNKSRIQDAVNITLALALFVLPVGASVILVIWSLMAQDPALETESERTFFKKIEEMAHVALPQLRKMAASSVEMPEQLAPYLIWYTGDYLTHTGVPFTEGAAGQLQLNRRHQLVKRTGWRHYEPNSFPVLVIARFEKHDEQTCQVVSRTTTLSSGIRTTTPLVGGTVYKVDNRLLSAWIIRAEPLVSSGRVDVIAYREFLPPSLSCNVREVDKYPYVQLEAWLDYLNKKPCSGWSSWGNLECR